MAEDNKALSRRFFEVMSSGDIDWFDEVMSPEYVQHDPVLPEDTHGIEAIKETMSGYLDAFPDLKMTVQDQIAEGDKVFTVGSPRELTRESSWESGTSRHGAAMESNT